MAVAQWPSHPPSWVGVCLGVSRRTTLGAALLRAVGEAEGQPRGSHRVLGGEPNKYASEAVSASSLAFIARVHASAATALGAAMSVLTGERRPSFHRVYEVWVVTSKPPACSSSLLAL